MGNIIHKKMNESFFDMILLTAILFGIYLIFTRNTEIGFWLMELSFIIFTIIFYIYIEKPNKKAPPN
jgi:hypothetical protein